ncbi:MAG: GNAT family N-acetyltransferase [Gammaproteobacteria bacterium]|nr:GNAT family N-acetyltransferase [Gammaproteobacteria bacterium]
MLVERAANITDIEFINSCILYGARKGHYSFDAENPDMVKAMKRESRSVIVDGFLHDKRRATATIFTLENNRIGTLIMCEVAPNAMGYEIYAMSVAKKHQRKGYGGQMLDSVTRNFLYDNVLARCLPVSEVMKKLLKSRGFVFHGEDGEYDTYVKTGFDCRITEEPMALRY